jgi:hypothetical protein
VRARAVIGALLLAAVGAVPAWAEPANWEQWQHLVGVVDVGGPRSDGNLVVMANGRLWLVSPSGSMTPFARGDDGYSGSVDGEPYLAVVPQTQSVAAAGCSFNQDDIYILDLTSPPGVARVDPNGHTSRLATISSVETLNGIALDTIGRFDHQLLVAGSIQSREVLFAVDCQGGLSTLADPAPPMEGGMQVAPASFGTFGGDLIAADENGGQVWAVDPSGTARVVLVPNLPTGGDTGVESVGFVPTGGGTAYLADRGTANNPFPGTDSILRLTPQALAAAGVQDGDLLVATEGGGNAVAIRCADACSAFSAATGPAGGRTGHIEGRITLIGTPAP